MQVDGEPWMQQACDIVIRPTVAQVRSTHICFVYCVITAVQNVRIPLFPFGNLASNQIHNKLRNVMATADEFVGGVGFRLVPIPRNYEARSILR